MLDRLALRVFQGVPRAGETVALDPGVDGLAGVWRWVSPKDALRWGLGCRLAAGAGAPAGGVWAVAFAGEVPVCWGLRRDTAGVCRKCRVEFMMTHEPAPMFVTDLPREGYR